MEVAKEEVVENEREEVLMQAQRALEPKGRSAQSEAGNAITEIRG